MTIPIEPINETEPTAPAAPAAETTPAAPVVETPAAPAAPAKDAALEAEVKKRVEAEIAASKLNADIESKKAEYGDLGLKDNKYIDEVPADLVDSFKTLAAKKGLDKETAKDIMGLEIEKIKSFKLQMEEQKKTWAAEVKTKFGSEEDPTVLTNNQLKVSQAFRENDETGEFLSVMKQYGLHNHPAVFKFMLNVAKGGGEPDFIKGDVPTGKPSGSKKDGSLFGGYD